MKRSLVSTAIALTCAALGGEAMAQPAPSAPAPADNIDDHPFYDARGFTLQPPATPKPKSVIVAASVDVSELFVPSLASAGLLIEPMVVAGNRFASGGIGYANLAGAQGIDFDVSFLTWVSAIRLFDANQWVGSWVLPDVRARFAFFPGGQIRLPDWILGLRTTLGGIRLARCFGPITLEMTGSATAGPTIAKFDKGYGAISAGGHFDIGLAFWRW